MNNFTNDYSDGAHEVAIKAIVEANSSRHLGYGYDQITTDATKLMKKIVGNKNADIHFFTGGTQLNLTAISSFLKSYEGVIAPVTGHINTSEAGSIESTGVKILPIESEDGKIYPDDIKMVLSKNNSEMCVIPKLVYISNTTETGLIYSKNELSDLYETCKDNNLIFYIDGARIAHAISSAEYNLTIRKIAKLCDVFYIGGTKNGMLSGEALVILKDELKPFFRNSMKQKGAILAKTWPVAIQFQALFEEDDYFTIAEHTYDMANKLYNELSLLDVDFLYEFNSNQLFPILNNELLSNISSRYDLTKWKVIDENHTAVRLVTSYSTTDLEVDEFINYIKEVF